MSLLKGGFSFSGSLTVHDNFYKHPKCRVRTTHQIIQIIEISVRTTHPTCRCRVL
ncbi:hypothetical protein [Alysiella crassa]|uniref:hypothetical protein n=1 Tax=Alysiella crassa TaxID=153491 RepID=UPI0012EB1EDE|nr:hypothetical protein [Alysiella crassa]